MRVLLLLSFVGVSLGQHCPSFSSCNNYHGTTVCASNGRTYANRCQLNVAICLAKVQHQIITYRHSGSCSSSTGGTHMSPLCHSDVICDEEMLHTKFCLSDGNTYESLCDAHNAECAAVHQHLHLSIVHGGECTNYSDCHARFYGCPRTIDYMCATNGYTYLNDCYFQQARCHIAALPQASNKTLEILHAGKCIDNSTDQARNVDCSQYADMSYADLATEGDLPVHINHCPYSTSHENQLCANGATYRDECSFCRTMSSMHKITYTQLSVPIAHDGHCVYHPIVG